MASATTGVTPLNVRDAMASPRASECDAERRVDAYLVHKCREARRVAESSRTAYEALYFAYRCHLHWIDPGLLPPGVAGELAEIRQRLCRCPDAVGIGSEDIRVRNLEHAVAEELRGRLIRLCLEIETLSAEPAGRARKRPESP